MSDLFSAAAVFFGLIINLAITEVMHQRPPNDTSTQAEVNIVPNGIKLNEVPHFTYFQMTLFWTKKSQHESGSQAAALAINTGE